MDAGLGSKPYRRYGGRSPEWCISRQRTWGVPIALFVHKETAELHPNSADLIEKVAQLVEQKGIQAWWDLDTAELLGAEDAANYEKCWIR